MISSSSATTSEMGKMNHGKIEGNTGEIDRIMAKIEQARKVNTIFYK